MKKVTLILAVLIAVAFIGTAMATPPGKNVEFDTSAGKVIFDGKVHADKGGKCADCHPKLFAMKKGALVMKKEDHVGGKACGVCHDGTKAFAQDEANCGKCHKK